MVLTLSYLQDKNLIKIGTIGGMKYDNIDKLDFISIVCYSTNVIIIDVEQ